MASSISMAASLLGLTFVARRKPNRPIKAIAPTVRISISPGAEVGLPRNAG